ncbi:hypothetical protein BCR41DRAFT_314920 [Lobosporangium transversale]|uniref:Homeodomain-like protein n=1 Tax=Lobosporangium transversale TaxID=64571 RepID=A0A1Y2G5U8_9FUNG|nr:hypothetical protein BCR41DRAFT_314920 [Lobosporangium transversale]ORY96038.1 hypothetical protein BCR41DRAFT_314920 [Lobosporangium transversale]|eukprot:XP_021875470.1 hypothetical protein BCR41DRAFT_314920 [Lobosporangium transversale]
MAKITPQQLRYKYYSILRRPAHVWSVSEETALIQHVLKHGTNQWEMISEALQTHSPEQCKERWKSLDMKTRNAKNSKDKMWYKVERGNFWRHYLRHGADWKELAQFLVNRTPEQCEAFFSKATASFDKSNPEKFNRQSNWTPEEDKALLDAAISYGSKNWIKIAASIPNRDKWQCRMRFAELQAPVLGSEEAAKTLAKAKKMEALFKHSSDL